MTRAPTNMLDAALCYVEMFDWVVFPVPPGSKKSHKAAKHSNGARWGATNKPVVIERDFRRWPKANLGIPTGSANGFWVLEADTPKGHDVDGIASLRELERQYGRLPKTLMAISPSGSLHYYFRWPKRVLVCNSTSKIAPGVDVRGEGGMVLAPPSVKDGVGRYRFLNWGTPVADAPPWLLKLVVRKKQANGKAVSSIDADAGMIEAALAAITDDSYQVWFEVGCALHFELGNAGFELFDAWSAASPKYNKQQCLAKWRECAKIYTYTCGTIFHYANEAEPKWRSVFEADGGPPTVFCGRANKMKNNSKISLEDFVAYLPMHTYIFLPTREPWPAASVDSQFPSVALLDDNGKAVLDKKGKPKIIDPSLWLDINRPLHQMTWAPGLQMLIRDKVVADGGWVDKPDAICLNLYRPPTRNGKRGKVRLWLDHVRKIYPDDHDHIIMWLAHRVQRPQDKINHALMLGGALGTGKDTLLEPVKYAVGPWNFAEVSPTQMMGRFNGFLKSVVLRISEARDLGESNRFAAYDHTKTYTAAPPDTLRVDEKNLREHYVFNCCGVIITTNYKTDGIYLPADDRRHYVAWSDYVKEDFSPTYWKKLWGWYGKGGIEAVTDYLGGLDISAFDAKAPPPKTPAFWAIVDANCSPEESELADILDKLGNPDVVTLGQITRGADENLSNWLEDRRNRRTIPHRMEKIGYAPVRNDNADSGLWRVPDDMSRSYIRPVNGPWQMPTTRQVIYAKSTLPLRDQLQGVQDLLQKATEAAKKVMDEAESRGKAGNGGARY